jgi:hypothetical protein
MRKNLCVLFLLFLGSAIFAADFGISLGGGAIFGPSFSKSVTNNMSGTLVLPPSYIPTSGSAALAYETKTFDVGAFVFGDFTFAELSLAYMTQLGNVVNSKMTTITGGGSMTTSLPDVYYKNHVILADLLGKYPFAITSRFSVFPALGVGLKFSVAGNANSDFKHSVWWGLSLKGGIGGDFSLTDRLFLRGEILFYFLLASDKEAEIPEYADMGVPRFSFKNEGYYWGPQFKLAIGYKLF